MRAEKANARRALAGTAGIPSQSGACSGKGGAYRAGIRSAAPIAAVVVAMS